MGTGDRTKGAWTTDSAAATERLGRRIGERLRPGDFVALVGDLGAGKTCLARGMLQGLDVARPGGSPTFVLIQAYAGRHPVYHADVYRLQDPAEVADLGLFAEADERVTIVEWADRIRPLWPPEHLVVTMTVGGEDRRHIMLAGVGSRFAAMIEELSHADPGA